MSKNLSILVLFSYFFSLTILPAFLYVFLDLSSMSWGILLGGLFILISTGKFTTFSSRNLNIKFFVLVINLVLFHAVISTFANISLKTFVSLLSLILLYISASSLSNFLSNASPVVIRKTLLNFGGLIFIILVISLVFDINFQNYSHFPANVFPYSEPSHFAIGSIAFIFMSMWLTRPLIQIMIILLSFLGGVLFPSLILLICSCLLLSVFLLRNSKIFSIFLLISVFLFIAYSWNSITNLDISYFAERIDFSDNNRNITALVYMQGWDRMIIALKSTSGLGVGLQNLDTVELGFYGHILKDIVGFKKNTADGSFLAAKFIAEFGVLGIFFIVIYLKAAFNSFAQLIRYEKNRKKNNLDNNFNSPLFIFAHSVIIVFFIDMFIRSPGYFTTGTILFLTGFVLISMRNVIPIIDAEELHSINNISENT